MNLFVHYVDHVTRSAAPRRVRRVRLTRTGVVSIWLCGIAILYFGSRLS